MSPPRISRNLILGIIALLAIGFTTWHFLRPSDTYLGISLGNGRLEATEVDVATKVAGRVAEVLVREGDNLIAGQVAAKLDADDLAAQLRAAESVKLQAQDGVDNAISQQKLAQITVNRTKKLIAKGFMSPESLDKNISILQVADANLAAARNKVIETEARVEALLVNLKDTSLRAPISGRVLYRLAEPGTYLGAGGKVFTLLDLSDVYMSIYLPTEEAGKIAVNSSAKIVLDALSNELIPAKVVFIAPRSQFTPKEVETRNEREKLMFRVKVKVDAEWLKQHADMAKPGMPGIAFVQTSPDIAWPDKLPPR